MFNLLFWDWQNFKMSAIMEYNSFYNYAIIMGFPRDFPKIFADSL